jgi:hypothetical protein
MTIDSALSATSTNPVQNKAVKAALDAKQDRMTIDSALNATSANPVQNKAVKEALSELDKKLISGVEFGTVSDVDGQNLERTDRMRTIGYLNRENYRGFTIRGTEYIYIWTAFYDKNLNYISTRPSEGWEWATSLYSNEIDTLPEDIAYLRLIFKKLDESDITEVDVNKIQDILSTIYPERRVTQLEQGVTQLEYQLHHMGISIFGNLGTNNVYIKGNSVFFKPNGFSISLNHMVYFIADASWTKTEDYVYTFSTIQELLVIDTFALSKVGLRNELSDVIKIIRIYENNTGYDYTRYIPLFYYYNKIFPLGECKDIFFPESKPESNSELTHEYINNEILFAPEFYAYSQGRYNDNNGVGTGWYKRFSLLHISDTHQYNALVKESLSVGNGKVAAIINTGDDTNGGSPEIIKNALNATAAIITSNCSIPYIGCNGNHDVPEITKKEYWDIMCSVINNKTSVVWGDAEGYRTYGYADFTSDDYEGNYRIIMLDPFDYDDGMFGVTYAFMSAVFSQKQINWLIESLLDAANKGYHVLTAMHYPFGDNTLQFNDDLAKPDAKFYQDAFMIPDIIDAIQNKLVFNRTYIDEKGVNNITINRDFSDAADLSYVAHLFGHIHSKNEYRCQKTDGSKKYDMLMLGEAALGAYGNALNKAYRKSGTINEIAFSALAVDPIEKCIYRVSYGSYLNYDKSNSERTVKIPYRYSAE